MVGLKDQYRSRCQDNFDASAIDYRGQPPMKRPGVKPRRGSEDAVLDHADTSADLDRITVIPVDSTTDRRG
jgi:hypothetical protein